MSEEKMSFSDFVATAIVVVIVGFLIFLWLFVAFVRDYEVGYKYDTATKTVKKLGRTGFFVTWPKIENIYTIDLRPMEVCLKTRTRILDCQSVKFNPDGLDDFLKLEGYGDYDGSMSTTTNQTVSENLNDILSFYAYKDTDEKYSFLTILPQKIDSKVIIKLPAKETTSEWWF